MMDLSNTFILFVLNSILKIVVILNPISLIIQMHVHFI